MRSRCKTETQFSINYLLWKEKWLHCCIVQSHKVRNKIKGKQGCQTRDIVSCSSTGVRKDAGGVAKVTRCFSSSGMDLPNCAKVFPESLAKIVERKGTSKKRRKVKTCKGTITRNGLTQKNERNVYYFFYYPSYFCGIFVSPVDSRVRDGRYHHSNVVTGQGKP